MPFLPIDSTIVTYPSRAHLSTIEGWMLFPDDEAARADGYTAAIVEIGSDLKRQTELSAGALADLFDIARAAKPLDQLREAATTPYRHGFMAGNILIAAIDGKDAKGSPLKLGNIMQMMAATFAPRRGLDSSFVNSIWQQYRSVSHLWAAHIEFTENRPDRRPVFPCQLQEVIQFLWLSEDWRKKGESTKTAKNSPSTILKPDECVRVPETMEFSK